MGKEGIPWKRIVISETEESFDSIEEFATCGPGALLPMINRFVRSLGFQALPAVWEKTGWEELERTETRLLLMHLVSTGQAYGAELRNAACGTRFVDDFGPQRPPGAL